MKTSAREGNPLQSRRFGGSPNKRSGNRGRKTRARAGTQAAAAAASFCFFVFLLREEEISGVGRGENLIARELRRGVSFIGRRGNHLTSTSKRSTRVWIPIQPPFTAGEGLI